MPVKTRRDCSGQILVIVLLGIVALAGLVFYVVNVGDQSNRRVEMQNAADAAAISGAAWMARSMNVVAMNNVACTRMLALVPILDAFPLSTQMAHEEVAAWVLCLENQLRRGVPDSRLRDGLESLKTRMAKQREILAPLDGFFNNSTFKMEALTFWGLRGYSGPPPHGTLWQAAQSLDEMGQAAAISAPLLAQADAVRYGQSDQASTAFIVPVLPELPARRTSYADFESPVKNGQIPDRAYPQRLGPYDRLFKWRDYRYHSITERDQYVPPTPGHGAIRGGSGNVNVDSPRIRGNSARGSTSTGHWTHKTLGQILLGYTVYGPFEWMRRRVHGYAQGWWHDRGYYPGELADTFFHEYHDQMSRIKLDYMWGSQQLRQMHYPQWVTDYPTAQALAARSDVRVTRTMFYVVEVRSKYPKDHPAFMSPGTFQTNGELPIAMWVKGWEDPADWKIPQVAEWVWEDRYEYETTEDWPIGIHLQNDATGQPIWQKVYMIAQYVFGGIDVGGEVEIRNPANFASREDLPAPILMDTAVGDYDVVQPHHDLGIRRDVFTYLGVAKQPNTARVWPQRFGSGNPYPGIVALAQAEIFNTRSWDLWTQDWKVKLVPVSRWGDWTERMARGIVDAGATGGLVRSEAVQAIQEYLARFDESMAGMMMHH